MSTTVDASPPATAVRYTATVAVAVAVLAGLLYYLGWVRTNALYGYFGIDANLMAYSPQDRFLRGLGLGFRPVAAILLGLAAALLIQVALRRFRHRLALAAVMLAGFLLAVPALFAGLGWLPLNRPLDVGAAVVAGVALIEIAATLWPIAPASLPERVARRIAVAVAAVVGLLWSFTLYAQREGTDYAAALVGNAPRAAVTSTTDLHLTAPGVTRSGAASAYRYEGLRLLVFRENRWFLFPETWTRSGPGAVIVLPDSPTLRVELSP